MRMECLSYALRKEEVFGVWGGMGVGKRRRLMKSMRIAIGSGWKEHLGDLEVLGLFAGIAEEENE